MSTTKTFPTITIDAREGNSQSARGGDAMRLTLWGPACGGGVTAALHNPDKVTAWLVRSSHRTFVSVTVEQGAEDVKGFLSVEQAIALRNDLNDAIAEAERGA